MIGIFDSGVGGLTVFKELVTLLPHQHYIYFADNANCPYGTKSHDEIILLSDRIAKFLINKGANIIVVACNTATAAAIDYLRANYNIPFVGMEPAIKPAALGTKTNSIGVLATAGTFNGKLYRETSQKFAAHVKVNYQVGEGLVELVEQGKANTPEAKVLLMNYIQPMLNENIDHLVLGCTHYPFFIPVLKEILPSHITVIDPAPAVALQTKRVLDQTEEKPKAGHTILEFYASGSTREMEILIKELKQKGLEAASTSFETITI